MARKDIEKILLMNEIRMVCEQGKRAFEKDIVDYYQDRVLEFNDVELSYWFASILPSSDKIKLGKIIIESKNIQYNYSFARYLEGSDVKAHGKVILESKDLEYNYRFLVTVPNADIKSHEKIILESNDVNYIYSYAMFLNENTKEKYSTQEILNALLESNDKKIIRMYYESRKEFLESINKINDFEEALSKADKKLKKIK